MRASEQGHWYNRDGGPLYEVKSTKGEMRPATLRDARKLNLVPGVTSVIKIKASFGLQTYLLNQAYLAALTLPRIEGESEDDFLKRAKTDAAEHAKAAAEKGTDIHAVIENHLTGVVKSSMGEMVEELLKPFGGDWQCEKSFAHPSGYGCRVDAYNSTCVVDFKSVDAAKFDEANGYDEHVMQLAACSIAIYGHTNLNLINVFVSRDGTKAKIKDWSKEEIIRGKEMFDCCLKLWQLDRNFDTSWEAGT